MLTWSCNLGINNYDGKITGSFRIYAKGKTVATAKITVRPESAAKLAYTGYPVTITEDDLKVMVGKTELSTSDFTIIDSSYTNNVNKGVAKVTIAGKGEYAGQKTVSFTIKPMTMSWWAKFFSL